MELLKITPRNARIKNRLFLFLFCVAVLFSVNSKAQSPTGQYSPGGFEDTVIDGYGVMYSLGEISTDDTIRSMASGVPSVVVPSSCSPGYFKLFLSENSGMADYAHNLTQAKRLNVLCQVLTDISDFINSPCWITGQTVNIWVTDSTTGVLGKGSPFYSIPRASGFSAIADNAAWITINSGKDAFINVASPLDVSGGGSSGTSFFHGSITFNWGSIGGSPINWHYDLNTSPASGEIDYYTVALHEMFHVLGFATLIDYNGSSVLGAAYPFYSRYDQHLQTHDGVNLLSTTAACDLYAWGWNPSLDSATFYLSPDSCRAYGTGVSDYTYCPKGLYYRYTDGSESIPVYTPACFERGSSLSHFEDECFVPADSVAAHSLGSVSSLAWNNHYYLMSDAGLAGPYSYATNPGSLKRYLKPEEKKVLCDIGYSLNDSFGVTSGANLNYVNYHGACPGFQVAGINDGITGGSYTWVTISGDTVNINAPVSILHNDYGADSFKCLYEVSGNGTTAGWFSVTKGNSTTTVKYRPGTGSHGVQLLCYIPYNSTTGKEGNITYIYVYVTDGSCIADACNIVTNGGFENYYDGALGLYRGMHCWSQYIGSPDAFYRGGVVSYDIPNTTFLCCDTPSEDVHNYPSTTNNHFIGMDAGPWSLPYYITEGTNETLSSSLTSGNTYVVSCWARLANAGGLITLPGHLQFATSDSSILTPLFGEVLSSVPSGLDTLCDFRIIQPDNYWHYYSQTVTIRSGVTANSLVMFNAAYQNPVWPLYPRSYGQYILVDDIKMIPVTALCSFTLPSFTCGGADSFNMRPYTCGYPGTFTWYAIVGGVRTLITDSFLVPALAFAATGGSGLVTVNFTYTDSLGCTNTTSSTIQINTPPIMGSPIACVGSVSVPLTDGYPGGTWSSSNLSVATIGTAGIINGVAPGTCTITYTTTCGIATLTATILPSPAPITGSPLLCIATTATVDDVTTGGTWSSGNTSVATVGTGSGVITGVSAGTASILYTISDGCSSVISATVQPSPTAIGGASHVCLGSTTTLSDGVSGGTWSSHTTTVATIGASTGVASGLFAGTTIITYTISDGCYRVATLTVDPLPVFTILGGGGYCSGTAGADVSLSGSATGFFYKLYSGGSATTDSLAGTGSALDFLLLPGGTYTVFAYNPTTGCSRMMLSSVTVTIIPAALPIHGNPNICLGSVTTLTDSTRGGTWSSSSTGVATVSSGVVTGIGAGTARITYSIGGACPPATMVVNVYPDSGSACTPCTYFSSAFTTLGPVINTNLGPGNYFAPGNVTVYGVDTFRDAVIMMATGDTMYIDSSAILTMDSTHIFSCNWWEGMALIPGHTKSGRLLIAPSRSSLIEDAITAVYIPNPVTPSSGYVLDLDNAVLNRNVTGVEIANYNSLNSNYPFLIRNTVFSGRNFSSVSHYPSAWPCPATLKAYSAPLTIFDPPFNIQNYPGADCKNGYPPYIGVRLDSVGADTPNTYVYTGIAIPTYYSDITIGDTTVTTGNIYRNLFDYLEYGIKATNSNLTVVNNAFINLDSRNVMTLTGTTSIGGDGIYAIATNDAINHNRLRVYSPDGSSYTNSMWGFSNGIECYNYFHVIAQKNYMINKSTGSRSISGPGGVGPTGLFGYLIKTAKYDKVDISYDTINNVNYGISFWALQDPVVSSTVPWQFAGLLNINGNLIQAHPAGYSSIATQRVSLGISIQNVLAQNTRYAISHGFVHTDQVNVISNFLNDVYDGIYVNYFWQQFVNTYENGIYLRSNSAAPSSLQYGINHTLCSNSGITYNSVQGSLSTPRTLMVKDSLRAYYVSNSSKTTLGCNTASYLGRGFEFFMPSPLTNWHDNTMDSTMLRGLVLNAGVIGSQVAWGEPSGNIWNGTWPAGSVQTYVIRGNANFSPLFVTGAIGTYPSPNTGLVVPYGFSNINITTYASSHLPCYPAISHSPKALYEHMAQEEVLYDFDIVPNNWMGQYKLWNAMLIDSTMADSSRVFYVFDSMAQNSRLALITNIEAQIAMGNIDSALTMMNYNIDSMANTSFDSATQVNMADGIATDYIVENYLNFFSLYIKYIGDTLSGADSVAIMALAGLCPERNGTVVYQARALYSAIYNDLTVFNDDSCINMDSTYIGERHSAPQNGGCITQNNGGQVYKLFPNPNDGNFTISQLMQDADPVNVNIWDALGRNIYKQSMSFIGSSNTLLLGNISPGVYLLKLTDSKARNFIFKFTVE